jgi:hypothetical protein
MLENLINSLKRVLDVIKFSSIIIRKELNHLYEAGYLNKNKQDNKVEDNVNIKHPLYDTMKRVVMKHLGLEDIVETVLDKMGNVKEILLIGDYAKGIDSGNIEIFLIGKNLNMDYIENLEVKIEKLINRKVTFYLSSKFSSNQTSIILYKNN